MKTARFILAMSLFALIASLFTSCAAKPGAPKLLIQPVLDALVPADFQGDGEFGGRGQWVGITLKARGLRRTEQGWTWTALSYRRTLSLPLFTGVPYQHETWVELNPPQNPER